MTIPSKEYLKELIADAWKKFDAFSPADTRKSAEETVTYIPTKSKLAIGLFDGLKHFAEMNTLGPTERQYIKSNCKHYNKLFRLDGNLIKAECYVDRKIDVVYIAYYEGTRRYLFPYFSNLDKAIGYYIIVSTYKNGMVVEEYLVNNTQILFESYDYFNPFEAGYYCVNYVPNGNIPVLGESEGIYNIKTFEYRPISNHVWCDMDK